MMDHIPPAYDRGNKNIDILTLGLVLVSKILLGITI